MALLRNLIGFLIATSLIAFAVTNRQSTTLVYSPLHEPLELPLYMVTLLFMGCGFFLGAVIVWMNMGKTRKTKREQRKTIKELEDELKTLKGDKVETVEPPSEFFPALPKAKTDDNSDTNQDAA